MPGKLNRRDFVKLTAGACCAAGFLNGSESFATNIVRKLELFDYSGVKLLDSRFKSQFQYARDLFFNISNDSLLLGFRQRAGLPAPGTPLIGWYGGQWNDSSHKSLHDGDRFHAFGQFVSGMARMSKATNDSAMLDKASFLIDEWAKTMDPDGYFYYSRQPQFPHYIYDKTVCGLVDMYAYGGNKNAIGYLEKITAWAQKNLDRTRPIPETPGDSGTAGDIEVYESTSVVVTVSIHARARRATRPCAQPSAYRSFNPRPRAAGDVCCAGQPRGGDVSIHARARRATAEQQLLRAQ